MSKETQTFAGRVYTRNPESKLRKYRNYFVCGKRLLHRDVWEFHNGPIPDGYDIHHMDEDRANNDIGNLECLPHLDHHKLHADALNAGAKAYREGNPQHDRVCRFCGKSFVSSRNYTRFCSKECQVQKRVVEERAERHRSALAIPRVCPQCSISFRSPHRATIYCSTRCTKRASRERA